MEDNLMKRTIGMWSAVALIVGLVVGASIFSLPGILAATAGPGVFISYIIAGFLALFMGIVAAQYGAVIDKSGSSSILVSRTFGPKISVFYSLCYIAAFSLGLTFVGMTMAGYCYAILPSISYTIWVIICIVVPGIINIGGNKLVSGLQNITVICFIGVILLFGFGGVVNLNIENFNPMFPFGITALIPVVVTAFFSYFGFLSIADIAGEIINPAKNLIRASIISTIVVIFLYVTICFAIAAVVPYTDLKTDTPLHLVSSLIFPQWVTGFITFGIILAGYTSQIAFYMAASRLMFALSNERVLPKVVGKLNKQGTPWVGITISAIAALIFFTFNNSLVQIANFLLVLLLATSFTVGLASFKIKKVFNDEYLSSGFKLKGFWYYFWPSGLLLTSLFFVLTLIKSDPKALIAGIICMLIFLVISFLTIKTKKVSVEE